MTVELRVRRAENLSLAEAIAGCGPLLDEAVAILYTPAACRFAVLSGASGEDPALRAPDASGKPAPLPLDAVFEARLFNAAVELRWLHESEGRGTAVLLSERPAGDLAACLDKEAAAVTAIAAIEQQYLLWGKARGADASPPGWSRLSEARVGTFWVPLALREGEHARLVTREYVTEFEDGNVAVAEERLLRLEPCQEATRAQEVAS